MTASTHRRSPEAADAGTPVADASGAKAPDAEGPEAEAKPPKLSVKPVTAARWPDFEVLFESKGAPKYCWCMAWRANAEERKHASGNAARKKLMKQRVDAGTPVGLLGYVDGAPVAWCSVAPRSTYQPLVYKTSTNEAANGNAEDRKIWSIVCFYILRSHRGQGLARQMMEAAVKYAKRRGAKTVEAYPVTEDSPSYRFMGFVPMFKQAGFHETGRAGTRRHVMQRGV